MAEEIVYSSGFKRISWGAIFAGAVVAIMVSLLLGLLGIAIGAATIHPASEANPLAGMGTGALVWWFVITIIALFAGGCAASRLSGVGRGPEAMLHGVVTWGVVTLAVLVTVGSAVGGLLSGAGNFLAGNLPTAARSWQSQPGISEPAGAAKEAVEAVAPSANGNASSESTAQARQTGEDVAQGTAQAAMWGLIALVIGAIAAALGGLAGRTRAVIVQPAV
jgi:hypothetical protein